MQEEKKVCVICKEEYEGWGNNAEPIAEGECCDQCNNAVIKERFNQLLKNK